jgi:hypothetical protein
MSRIGVQLPAAHAIAPRVTMSVPCFHLFAMTDHFNVMGSTTSGIPSR